MSGSGDTGDTGKDDEDGAGGQAAVANVLGFPQTRVRPPSTSPEPYNDLGSSKMCIALGMPKEQTTGHWCSFCKGIWFGYLLEVECPVCGNRDG